MVDKAVAWAWVNFLSSVTQEGMHKAVAIGHRLAQVFSSNYERNMPKRNLGMKIKIFNLL